MMMVQNWQQFDYLQYETWSHNICNKMPCKAKHLPVRLYRSSSSMHHTLYVINALKYSTLILQHG